MKKLSFVLYFGLAGLALIANPTQAANCALTTDSMYQAVGSKAVYYITSDCKKQAVKSPDAFFSHATSWAEVKKTNSATLSGVPDHQFRFLPWGPRRELLGGSLIKSPTDPRVFLVTKFSANNQEGVTTLVPFDSEQAITGNGFKWSWVEDVAQSVISRHPISSEKIKANVNHFPVGMLFKIENAPALFITRIDPTAKRSEQYAEYITSLDGLKKRGYRFDRVPVIPSAFYYDSAGVPVVQNKSASAVDSSVEDGAVCADTNSAVSGLVVVCQSTTVRVTSFMKARIVAVTQSEIVVSLIKDTGSSQTWTIPVGQTKSSTFFEDANNVFSITFEKFGSSPKLGKPVAFIKFKIAAAPSKPTSNNAATCATTNAVLSGLVVVCQDDEVMLSANTKLKLTRINNTNVQATWISNDGTQGSSQIDLNSEVGHRANVDSRTFSVKYVTNSGTSASGKPAAQIIIRSEIFDSRGCDRTDSGEEGLYYVCDGYEVVDTSSGLTIQVRGMGTNFANFVVPNSPSFTATGSPSFVRVPVGGTVEFAYLKDYFGLHGFVAIDLISASLANQVVSFRVRTTL